MYNILAPQDYDAKIKKYVERQRLAIKSLFAERMAFIYGIKDIHSRYLATTDAHAKVIGLANANEVIGRLDKEMPCLGTAHFADVYVQEDQAVISKKNPNQLISSLKVHYYASGFGVKIINKTLFCHHASRSILGICFYGCDVNIANIFKVLPQFISEYVGANAAHRADGQVRLHNGVVLTNYEHEICFLLAHGFHYRQIADFMNHFRMTATSRTADTIIKKKNVICDKLNIYHGDLLIVRSELIRLNLHSQIPVTMREIMVGCHPSTGLEPPLPLPALKVAC